MQDLELITAPASLLTVDELRAQVRADSDDEDDQLEAYLAAATGHLDGYGGILGRAIGAQTWRLYLAAFPAKRIRLPLPPLRAVTSITYRDANGDQQTLAADRYVVLEGERAEIELAHGATWPSTRGGARAVAITFICGWARDPDQGWPAKVQPILQAIRLMVSDMYDNRGSEEAQSVGELQIPTAAKNLLQPLKLPRFGRA